jgi:16S rRNA (cytosine967-C5)-methyltransferase
MNQRAIAASVIHTVVMQHRSLSDLLPKVLEKAPDPKTQAFIKELCFGCLRWYSRLSAIANELLHTPMKDKHADVFCLMLTGIYQIAHLSTPDYAAVSETVSAAKALKKPWAKGLLNQTLRAFVDNKDAILAKLSTDEARYAHPTWLIDTIKKAWPDNWGAILEANNTQAPLFLRVNRLKASVPDYLTQLDKAGIPAKAVTGCPDAIHVTTACPVTALPGFDKGLVSVQDISGQLATPLLKLKDGMNVLDCCAAPGSKTTHMLEIAPGLSSLSAIDNQPSRLPKIRQNLERLDLPHNNVHLTLADVTHVNQWWSGTQFDHILVDAPCSATGVIRRHPDIKWLREARDINALTQLQALMLAKVWPLLKPGGLMLYSTCSILPAENSEQIQQFCKTHKDATLESLDLPIGHIQNAGWQVLPTIDGADGFFYALLKKKG